MCRASWAGDKRRRVYDLVRERLQFSGPLLGHFFGRGRL